MPVSMFSPFVRCFRASRPAALTAALLAAATLSPAAHAQVTTFSNRTAFLNATTGVTTINFNDQVNNANGFTSYTGETATLSGVTFTANGRLFAVDSTFSNGDYSLGDNTVLSFQQATVSPNSLTILLPTGTTAFGMDFGSLGTTGGLPFTFSFTSGGSAFSFTRTSSDSPTNTPIFFGVTAPGAITSLLITTPNTTPSTISLPGDTVQIDRFSFVAPTGAAAPEPGSLALLGTGLIGGAGSVMQRRRRKAA